jgi:beta propeller repeat protein
MKKPNKIGYFFIILMLSSAICLSTGCMCTRKEKVAPIAPPGKTDVETFFICTEKSHHYNPRIDGEFVVWQDERNGNMDIYGYNLSTGTEFPICTELHEQNKPHVSGTTVVWEDERHSWWEEELNYWFYGYDLSKEKEFPIARYETIFGIQDFSEGIIVYYDKEEELYENIVGLILP